MSQAQNVCQQLDPHTGEPIDAITATALRRHHGNTLVVPPVKHRGNGVFETAVLDGHGGYFYPSERPYVEAATSPPFVPFPVDTATHTAPHGDPLAAAVRQALSQ